MRKKQMILLLKTVRTNAQGRLLINTCIEDLTEWDVAKFGSIDPKAALAHIKFDMDAEEENA